MDHKVKLTAIPDGPLKVEGRTKLVLPGGRAEEKDACYICRCSKSKNQPFCDGSHSQRAK